VLCQLESELALSVVGYIRLCVSYLTKCACVCVCVCLKLSKQKCCIDTPNEDNFVAI